MLNHNEAVQYEHEPFSYVYSVLSRCSSPSPAVRPALRTAYPKVSQKRYTRWMLYARDGCGLRVLDCLCHRCVRYQPACRLLPASPLMNECTDEDDDASDNMDDPDVEERANYEESHNFPTSSRWGRSKGGEALALWDDFYDSCIPVSIGVLGTSPVLVH